jgi:MFS family permease
MAKEHVIHDQTDILPKKRLLIVFSGLAIALLTTYIDQNSIGVALPTIGRDLNSASTIVWAGTSSLIANTAFQPLYGRISDIFGRKIILISCLCILALGDLLCGFAQTGPQLYAFRGISGLSNGGIMALTMMIVSDVVTLEDRGKYEDVLHFSIETYAFVNKTQISRCPGCMCGLGEHHRAIPRSWIHT